MGKPGLDRRAGVGAGRRRPHVAGHRRSEAGLPAVRSRFACFRAGRRHRPAMTGEARRSAFAGIDADEKRARHARRAIARAVTRCSARLAFAGVRLRRARRTTQALVEVRDAVASTNGNRIVGAHDRERTTAAGRITAAVALAERSCRAIVRLHTARAFRMTRIVVIGDPREDDRIFRARGEHRREREREDESSHRPPPIAAKPRPIDTVGRSRHGANTSSRASPRATT